MDKIDSNSIKILTFLYDADSKTVREIMNKFQLHAESRRDYIYALLEYFVDEGYLGIITDQNRYVLRHNVRSYVHECALNNRETILPTYSVYLLPAGRAIVESSRRNKWYFLAPLAISIISAVISVGSLLYQVFDNAPILVELMSR
jgi:hypothetical protein